MLLVYLSFYLHIVQSFYLVSLSNMSMFIVLNFTGMYGAFSLCCWCLNKKNKLKCILHAINAAKRMVF